MGLLLDLLKSSASEGGLFSALGRWRQHVSLALDNGVSICGGLTQTVYVDAAADAGGDGSICTPYQTITQALIAIGSPVDAADQAKYYTLLIAGGLYDEDLTIPSGRKIRLRPLDGVTLGTVAESGLRNITFTNNSADLFGGTGELHIDGPFYWQDTFVNDDGVNGSPTQVIFTEGTQSRIFNGSGHDTRIGGLLTVEMSGPRSQLNGAFIGSQTSNLSAFDVLFSGDVTTNTYQKFVGCRFLANITVTTAPSFTGDYGFHRCGFISEGTLFTGPATSFAVDSVSHNSFEDSNGTFAGGARVLRLDDSVLKSEVTLGADVLVSPPSKVIFCKTIPVTGITVTLPATPQIDDEYFVKDADGSASASNVISVAGNGYNIDALASQSIDTTYGSLHVKFSGTAWALL